jgi:hypothetical protein
MKPLGAKARWLLATIVCIGFICIGWVAHAFFIEMRPKTHDFEVTPAAIVIMSKGKTPGVIDVQARDSSGTPIPGATVTVWNNSGGNAAVCNSSGVGSISVGEPDVEKIQLNGVTVLDRPNGNGIGAARGLQVLILMK